MLHDLGLGLGRWWRAVWVGREGHFTFRVLLWGEGKLVEVRVRGVVGLGKLVEVAGEGDCYSAKRALLTSPAASVLGPAGALACDGGSGV